MFGFNYVCILALFFSCMTEGDGKFFYFPLSDFGVACPCQMFHKD